MNLIRLFLMLVFLLPTSVLASITEGGTGMIFGSDHAFCFTAPAGWVLDNQRGRNHDKVFTFLGFEFYWLKDRPGIPATTVVAQYTTLSREN
ncbi:MAG: hypothetical protein HKP58_00110 [Desulfatitalea sp.]|nr:hypothetical protein [Desulfatitalea sp.]NNJ98792.1 hypothetical protein [Desulfatitalea sp.]